MVTNSSGTVVEESDYYPFGSERVITDNLDNNYKFTGHERDTESGLDHTLYRQYASSLGRWQSPDRVRGKPVNPQSFNRYAYTRNDPCNARDRDGAISNVPEESYWDPFVELWIWPGMDPFFSYPSFPVESPYVFPTDEDRANAHTATAVAVAKTALQQGPCKDLFNLSGKGMDPAQLLDAMANPGQNNYKYGYIGFGKEYLGEPLDSDAITTPSEMAKRVGEEDGREVWDNVVIVINSDPYRSWSARDNTDNDRARLLIHELGHVFNMLAGAGGSKFEYDRGDPDAQARNGELERQCVSEP